MLIKLLTKVFGSRNDRTLRRMRKVVNIINAMEPEMEKLSDEELKGKTAEFRARLEKGEVLENLIPEAFAVVREASKRVFGMRHFDVQLLGGMVLNERCIAEMRTGEGKTLTATLPAYLNALTGKGVHVVTVNDYLAQRDAENNRPLFEFLGLTVGINLPGMPAPAKREAYAADITYGTNNEYGFDYLRDNMAFSPEERVQRKLHYALVDEVDSILIDEARTPLIISGPAEDSSEMYKRVNKIIPHLIRQEKEDSETFQGEGHFSVDEKSRQVNLTERGLVLIEELLVKEGIMDEGESLYSPANIMLMHHVTAALRAHALFTRDVDYIVKDGEVIIVDEHTGRTMQGRRWSDGLHQAVEAKEGVQIQNENQTLASITFQNYFRLYEKLAGMTGTADTEAFEFSSIYKLDTVVVPTNRPMIRKDLPDLVYMTEAEKIQAIIEDIKERTAKGQPVLVGTISIEKSELLSKMLRRRGIGAGSFMVFVFILPMWMNFMLRILAWKLLLSKNGVINSILTGFGLSRINIINTPTAVVLGMVYDFLPFMLLPIYNSMTRIRKDWIEAARDLGAGNVTIFLKIILPLTVSGIISGIVMVFVPSLTSFAISQVLGGGHVLLIGNVIEQDFMQGMQWNAGSGLSFVLMIFVIASMTIVNIFDKEGEGTSIC